MFKLENIAIIGKPTFESQSQSSRMFIYNTTDPLSAITGDNRYFKEMAGQFNAGDLICVKYGSVDAPTMSFLVVTVNNKVTQQIVTVKISII